MLDSRFTLDVASPDKVSAVLVAMAQKYREDAEELRSAWQDEKAGSAWDAISLILEATAIRVDRAVEKHFR